MKRDLCISVRFIHPYPLYHGRADGGEPEWPPSPMRVFQALLNAACMRVRGRSLPDDVRQALECIEPLRPSILASSAQVSSVGYRTYVPHNHGDLVTSAWHRGHSEESIASHRIEKDLRPMRIIPAAPDDLPSIHYLYSVAGDGAAVGLLRAILPSARAITHLGWGIDQVVGDASLVDPSNQPSFAEQWVPDAQRGRRLRVPRAGSLAALLERHDQFMNRLRGNEWTPVRPFSVFDSVRYRRSTDPLGRPWVGFKLVDSNDDTYSHPHAKVVHLAGMLRHLAIEAMSKNPPRNIGEPTRWIEQYVAGHRDRARPDGGVAHSQLSYVPVPSVGHEQTDPSVRRAMIIGPVGDDEILEHLARRLDGRRLIPERPEHLREPAFLSWVRTDRVLDRWYTRLARHWASFTPVILPGHDDHKPEKTRRLILKALSQSGIDQPCEFRWAAVSHFAKSYSAHRYVRDWSVPDGKRQIGYLRPAHLSELTAVHLWLSFERAVQGPLVVGAGRHCGFGLLVAFDD